MRFGLFWQTPGHEGSSNSRRHWETVEEIILGEELGFESAWLAESIFYPTRPMSNPLMVAIAAAQHTERIRFGTLAAQAPLHHPFHIASQSATCDILTNGRLDLCLGGRWGTATGRFLGNPVGTSREESRERVAETVELIKLAWTQERFDFEGKYWKAENLPVLPKPTQQPHPPILLAANSDETFPYAAKMGIGAIATTLGQPMPGLIDRLACFEAAKPSEGVTQRQDVNVMVSFFVADTRKEAQELMRENWRDSDAAAGIEYMKSLGIDPSEPNFSTGAIGWMTWGYDRVLEVCIYDEPSACVERLQSLQAQLPTMHQCILEFNRRGRIPSERVRESMRLFADKVMPGLEAVPSAN